MKQLYGLLKTGKFVVSEVPQPTLGPGRVLVRVAASLVSTGTERTIVEFAQQNLFAKAKSRPDLLRQLVQKARRDGIVNALTAAQEKLDRPQSLGYSCAGTVIAVGEGVNSFRIGDRVACAGGGFANHAEVVSVPKNLVAALPNDTIPFEEAAFTTIGSIALQGLRLAETQLGETVAIIGLGLIGLLTAELASIAGCSVLGMDPDASRCAMAQKIGCAATATNADEFESLVAQRTASHGADAVIITASSQTNAPVELAGTVARQRAKVVAVGQVGTTLPRKIYFDKELHFVVSRSYGPGRYDAEYEEKGRDYPISYVRWTENRNMQAFLQFLAAGKLQLSPLISHRFEIEDAERAYELISAKNEEPSLGVLLTYRQSQAQSSTVLIDSPRRSVHSDRIRIGVLGCGEFARGVLLPAMQKAGVFEFKGICAASGANARHAAEKFQFQYCTSDDERIIDDPELDAVVIATRHNLHAHHVIRALGNGKHVFCEKPLCITNKELIEIASTYLQAQENATPLLMVGFNRRFSPLALKLREFLRGKEDNAILHYRVNAGFIPRSHWIQDAEIGGGRIVGEVCHFVDLIQFLADSHVANVYAEALPDHDRYLSDNLAITLKLRNGSVATITYVANGDRRIGKERIELFSGGASAVLDDFRSLELIFAGKRKMEQTRFRQQKGHYEECRAFAEALRSGISPISFESICSTTLATFAIQQSLTSRGSVEISVPELFEKAAVSRSLRSSSSA